MISSNSKNDEIAAEYGYDKLFDYMDENGDGKISDDEISALGFDINDIENLTAANIRQIAKLAGLPDIDDKGEVKKADEKEEKEKTKIECEGLS